MNAQQYNGYIYVVKSVLKELDGYVKVGKTQNSPAKRFNTGITGKAYFKSDIIIYGVYLIWDVDKLEKRLHKRLAPTKKQKHVDFLNSLTPDEQAGLEWFPVSPKRAKNLIEKCCTVVRKFEIPEGGFTRRQFSNNYPPGGVRSFKR